MNKNSHTRRVYDHYQKFLAISNLANIVENKMNDIGYSSTLEEALQLIKDSKDILEKILNEPELQ